MVNLNGTTSNTVRAVDVGEGSGIAGRVSFNAGSLESYISYFSGIATTFKESKEVIETAISACQQDDVWSGDTRADADLEFDKIKSNLNDMLNNLKEIQNLLQDQYDNFRNIRF